MKRKILVAYKKSILSLYQQSRDQAVLDFIQDKSNRERLNSAHLENMQSLEAVCSQLQAGGIEFDLAYRGDICGPVQSKYSAIVVVGGDGTFLDVAHKNTSIPMLGINSCPSTSVGYYMSSTASNFMEYLTSEVTYLQRIAVSKNDVMFPELALNELLISHENPAAMTKYKLEGKIEKNSGLLVSTPSGCGGWIVNAGGQNMPIDAKYFQYLARETLVREPRFGTRLTIELLVRNGRVYIDGEHISHPLGLRDSITLTLGSPLPVLGRK